METYAITKTDLISPAFWARNVVSQEKLEKIYPFLVGVRFDYMRFIAGKYDYEIQKMVDGEPFVP